MVKYESQGVALWIDQDTGSLIVETELGDPVEVNYHDAGKILGLLKQDRNAFEDKVKEENNFINRAWKRLNG